MADEIADVIERDAEFLSKFNIMDYSLLLAVENLESYKIE